MGIERSAYSGVVYGSNSPTPKLLWGKTAGLNLGGHRVAEAILGWEKRYIDRLLSIRWEVRGSGWDGMGWRPIDRY
jgi:hypothetical protein